jgi:hypothetical protein
VPTSIRLRRARGHAAPNKHKKNVGKNGQGKQPIEKFIFKTEVERAEFAHRSRGEWFRSPGFRRDPSRNPILTETIHENLSTVDGRMVDGNRPAA